MGDQSLSDGATEEETPGELTIPGLGDFLTRGPGSGVCGGDLGGPGPRPDTAA